MDYLSSYKHGIDGLIRVAKEEGVGGLFSGSTMASTRAVVITVGQLSVYDQIKQVLLSSEYFEDNSNLHLTTSVITVFDSYKF